jgi:histidyl-tRNA synthetase
MNPLRIFDCKVPQDQPIIDALPHSVDYLCDACREHFAAVERHLGMYGIPYRVSHRLVRGLDYYTRTTFEILAGNIGAQNAILGGGRYDGLVKQLGGPDRVGIGFAAGIERLVLAMPGEVPGHGRRPLFVAAMGEPARESALALLRDLRRAGLEAHMEYEGRSIKSQMKRADRLKAAFVLILGDDELASGVVSVKDMSAGEQSRVSRDAVIDHCRVLGAGGQE